MTDNKNFPQAIFSAMNYLDVKSRDLIALRPYVRRLQECEIKVKPFWFPWPTYSTTVGPRKIYLARNWLDWKPPWGFTLTAEHARNLLHEAVHALDQWEKYGSFIMGTRYLVDPSFRQKCEDEANEFTAKWLGI